MAEFPTCDELRARYEAGMGFSLADEVAKPLVTPYSGGEAKRRYYQDAAIRAVFEKVAKAEKDGEPKRALLSLATGAGKTFIAVQLLRRIADAEQDGPRPVRLRPRRTANPGPRRTAKRVRQRRGGRQHPRSAKERPHHRGDLSDARSGLGRSRRQLPADALPRELLHPHHHRRMPPLGLGQVVAGADPQPGSGPSRPDRHAPGNRRNLRRPPEAKADAQITADNLKYFGEPVYEYSLGQGIEDGYLAACEIKEGRVNLDDTGITIDDIMARNPIDAITGQPVTLRPS